MKLYVCQVYGAMGGERSGAAYPTMVLCENCLKEFGGENGPDSRIVSKDDWDESWPDQCENESCEGDPDDIVEL